MQDKVKYLKDKKTEIIANINYNNAINNNAQNPIVSKLLAYRKTKKQTNPKDLL